MMKKIIVITAMAVLGIAALYAQTPEDEAWAEQIRQEAETAAGADVIEEEPAEDTAMVAPVEEEPQPQAKKKGLPYPYRRIFEIGVNAGAGFSNNSVGIDDIFRQTLVINQELVDKIKTDGFLFDFNIENTGAFINFNTQNWGFGVTASVTGDGTFGLPKALFTLLSEGNKNSHSSSGTIDVYGAMYADTSIDIHMRFLQSKKLKISFIPSMFVPIAYVPKEDGFSYKLLMEDGMAGFSVGGAFNLYTPFSLDDMDSVDYMSALEARGFDLSLNAEYDFFSDSYDWLTAGFTVKSIPLIASTLSYRTRISLVDEHGDPWTILEPTDDLLGTFLDDNFDLNMPDEDDFEATHDEEEITVRRPVRFDLYANMRPLGKKLIVVRPSIGLTTNTIDKKAHFNYSLTAELNTPIFLLHLSTAYDELIFKHGVMIGFNFRVIELDVGVDIRSRDFAQSFSMSGAKAWVGARIGF
ncbi:MAG: hypothetical protein LBP19_02590 [Treponema sp.]|jgi:hypothetical protein|nr:hypothetical protein [Treponema sp.]